MQGLAVTTGIVFVVLKFLGVIAWSWLWVLSPFWILALLYVVSILLSLIFGATVLGLGALFLRNK